MRWINNKWNSKGNLILIHWSKNSIAECCCREICQTSKIMWMAALFLGLHVKCEYMVLVVHHCSLRMHQILFYFIAESSHRTKFHLFLSVCLILNILLDNNELNIMPFQPLRLLSFWNASVPMVQINWWCSKYFTILYIYVYVYLACAHLCLLGLHGNYYCYLSLCGIAHIRIVINIIIM